MKFLSHIRNSLDRHTLRKSRLVMGLIAVAVVAFLLGGLILGGGGPATEEHVDHDADTPSAPELWTCSMHPQIKLPKPGKCPICYMDLIPLETGGGEELGPRQLRLSATAKELARIQTTPAVLAIAEAEVRMVGSITYDETTVAYITAWVPGRLDRLYADYTGFKVNKGDRLVSIYSPDLLAAQEELIQAKKAVSSLGRARSEVLLSTAKATLGAVRDKLRLFGLTAEQINEIENSLKTSDHLTIYAPIGGVVVHKNALEGMYVQTGSQIYTIANLSKLWVMFEAYESDLPWLRDAQTVEFTSPSFPGERFQAAINFIDPIVDPKKRTIRVRAVVDNDDGRLKPDMFVHGVLKSRIDIGGKTPLLIPASAPLLTGKRAVVYVEIPNDEGPLFEGREVELGPRAGDYYVVKSGVEEGELVVSNGAFKIDSELQIQAKPSMMSPSGGAPAPGHQHGSTGTKPPSGEAHTKHDTGTSKIEVDAKTLAILTPVYDAYFDVRTALAADDLGSAKKAGAAISSAVGKVDMFAFTGRSHKRWMELAKKISESADEVSKAKDIKAARNGFFFLSKATIDLQREFGHTGDHDVYLGYCPMARDGDGAYWLQKDDELRNPYFGASMLYCGSIKETYKAASGGVE